MDKKYTVTFVNMKEELGAYIFPKKGQIVKVLMFSSNKFNFEKTCFFFFNFY